MAGIMAFTSAHAVPLVWTLTGVTFTDGGTASGTFTYDAETNTYSAINISTTAGSVFTGPQSFNFVCVAPCNRGGTANDVVVTLTASSSSNLTGTPYLAFIFLQPLSNLPGTRSLLGQQATCSDASCSGFTGQVRVTTAGNVTTTGAPVFGSPRLIPTLAPASLALLALVIALAGGIARLRFAHR